MDTSSCCRMSSDDIVVHTLHTDMILELTGEYKSSEETREDRLTRKLNEEYDLNNTVYNYPEVSSEFSTRFRETCEERLDRKLSHFEVEQVHNSLTLTVGRSPSLGYRRNNFQQECHPSMPHDEENTTNRDANFPISQAPASIGDVRIRRRPLGPPLLHRQTCKRAPQPPLIMNNSTDLSLPGAYCIPGNDWETHDDSSSTNSSQSVDETLPQSHLEDTGTLPIQKTHPCCLRSIGIGFLMLIFIGIVIGISVVVSSRTHPPGPLPSIPLKISICSLDDIYLECQIEGATTFQSKIPECAFSQYLSLGLDFLPLELPMIPVPSVIISCAPENLALLTLAANGEFSRNKFILITIYFATKGQAWTHTTNWLSSAPVCSWHGVTCQNDSDIVEVDLSNNSLGGSLPSVVGLLDQLQVLNLGMNSLGSTIPETLSGLSKLTDLDLSMNIFEKGAIPSHLSDIKSIEKLDLTQTQRTGALSVAFFGGMTNLHVLRLGMNSLSGTIPTELFFLTSLLEIDLNRNTLHGSIPTEIKQLTSIENLGISTCNLTGTLPTEIGLLTSLRAFVFDWNNFSGSIPREVCALWDIAPLGLFGGASIDCYPDEGDITSFVGHTDLEEFFGGLTCPTLECCRTCEAAFKG